MTANLNGFRISLDEKDPYKIGLNRTKCFISEGGWLACPVDVEHGSFPLNHIIEPPVFGTSLGPGFALGTQPASSNEIRRPYWFPQMAL